MDDSQLAALATRTELGCAGHLIVADKCRWHRHTQLSNGYRVSTIGNYILDNKRKTIGAGERSFYETMVFRTTNQPEFNNDGCGCMEIADWSEIDGERYATAGDAQLGHETFVAKYQRALAKESEG